MIIYPKTPIHIGYISHPIIKGGSPVINTKIKVFNRGD